MSRTIIPTTLADLLRAADYAGPGAEFYIKEITTLDQWHRGVPHLPHNRVWCGFNSFNIPDPGADRAMLSLQGAGDLLILSQFVHDTGDIDFVTCYRDRAEVLGRGITAFGIPRIGPTEALFCHLRHKYAYVSNHPAALQFLKQDAVDLGWDHYDWFGLMLGIRPKEKWIHLEWEQDITPETLAHPVVAVHPKASTEDRSLPELWAYLHNRPDGVNYILVGNSGRTYHQTYRMLQQVDAVIAVDSVVLHMAVVARPDLPVLGLYTSTPTTWRGPDRPGVDRIHVDKNNLKEVYLWLRRRL